MQWIFHCKFALENEKDRFIGNVTVIDFYFSKSLFVLVSVYFKKMSRCDIGSFFLCSFLGLWNKKSIFAAEK